jgi:hypothetical protein
MADTVTPQPQPQRSADGHLATCKHDGNCCVVPERMIARIGKRWATALSGLIAGVVIASIVFIPWMVFQRALADEACFEKVGPSERTELRLKNEESLAAPSTDIGTVSPEAAPIQ